MKKSHIKIIKKIEGKIAHLELLVKGYTNDGDKKTARNTEFIIQGLVQSIEVIKNLKQKDVNKSILKEADKLLCLGEDQTILEAVNLIITDFNNSGDKLIDWIDDVTPIEKFEHTFSITVFLNLIGIKCNVNEKVDLLF
jgi:hypothetical protein